MSDDDLLDLILEDMEAWLECGSPTTHVRPARAAYYRAIALVFSLRAALDEPPGVPSLLAEVMRREDETLGAGIVIERLRMAALRAIEESQKSGNISVGTIAALQLARE